MKLPSKYIALVVVLSLVAIFAYQAYWLVNLYRTQRQEVEHDIREAMRLSDYNEIILRVDRLDRDSTEHGEVSVNAGFNNDTPYVESRTIVTEQKGDSTLINLTQQTVKDTAHMESSLHTNDMGFLFGRKNTMQELAAYFQQGLHAGLDIIRDPDFQTYDSLLRDELQRLELSIPYRLMYIHRGEMVDSSYTYIDTLGVRSTDGYVPSARAKTYEYSYDLHDKWLYRLTTEPLDSLVLRQMTGILATSAFILVVLGFSFWYLIRILLRQKTLEEMKDDFTNNITHELKTPIAVAYAANDALLNFGADADEAKRNRYLHVCQEQLKILGGLVEQILSMSMERRNTLHITPNDLTVTADRTHFRNIVSNLLDNAIKYSEERAEVEIDCHRQGGTFVLAVRDKGIGIAKEKQTHVFDKFYRVPTGNLHNVKGYGLGLYYVKTMAERHGGTVEVESEPGQGSKFTIKFTQIPQIKKDSFS